jgi:hypothetical protein
MSAESEHETFRYRYEPYYVAKQRGQKADDLAVMVLAEVRKKSGVSADEDREANIRALHDLLGPLHSEADTRQIFDQLRKTLA